MKKLSLKSIIAIIVAFLSASAVTSVAVAAKGHDDNTRPGYGYGDDNHEHTGPPGHHKHDDGKDDNEHGENNHNNNSKEHDKGSKDD